MLVNTLYVNSSFRCCMETKW